MHIKSVCSTVRVHIHKFIVFDALHKIQGLKRRIRDRVYLSCFFLRTHTLLLEGKGTFDVMKCVPRPLR